MNLRRVFFWFVAICLVFYMLSNPAQAASQIRGAFESGATFVSTLAG